MTYKTATATTAATNATASDTCTKDLIVDDTERMYSIKYPKNESGFKILSAEQAYALLFITLHASELEGS